MLNFLYIINIYCLCILLTDTMVGTIKDTEIIGQFLPSKISLKKEIPSCTCLNQCLANMYWFNLTWKWDEGIYQWHIWCWVLWWMYQRLYYVLEIVLIKLYLHFQILFFKYSSNAYSFRNLLKLKRSIKWKKVFQYIIIIADSTILIFFPIFCAWIKSIIVIYLYMEFWFYVILLLFQLTYHANIFHIIAPFSHQFFNTLGSHSFGGIY